MPAPRRPITPRPKACYLCVNNIKEVDYKDAVFLRKFMSSHAKIAPPRRSGLCAMHQRKTARAIKRARVLGLVPYAIQ